MRVLLVGPDHESNLSLLYLAASLRSAGHAPVIAAFNTGADAPEVMRAAEAADLVGLSMCFQVRATEFLALADALKRAAPGRPVIAGGHHASCAASELLEHHAAIDLVVVHEGEDTLVELANLGEALLERAGEVRGVVVREGGRARFTAARPIRADLDRLPRPDRSGPARLLCGVPTAYLMGSRGCVSDCDYCCITTLHRLAPGPRFRQRTPEDVGDEMGDLYHRHGVRQFVFHDDNFLVPSAAHNRERIARLDTALRARGVRDVGLVTKCSPRDAERGALEALRRMGLLRLFMGIESGSSCGLASIGRRQTVEQSERALSLCEELGISTQYTMIIFHPEATVASMIDDLDFVARHPAHPLNYCRAEIYAGTPLEARMVAAGRAEGDHLGRTYRYADAQVATVWQHGRDVFAGRCWGQDDLLGSVIRLDHQVAVLRHFYDGRGVDELVRSFLAWQVDLNLETAGLFRELVLACGEAKGAADGALRRAVADLRRREASSREARLRQLCGYRAALARYARASVALGRRHARAAASGRSFVGPRHAAAVAAAIGVLGSGGAFAHDHGVAEAAPPPIRPVPMSPPTFACRPTAEAPLPFQHDQGVAEAAPPPIDERRRPPPGRIVPGPGPQFREDLGVAEAAPPPYEREVELPRAVIPRGHVQVWTKPPVPLLLGGQHVQPVFALEPNAVALTIGQRRARRPLPVRMCALTIDERTVVRFESERPLTVRSRLGDMTAPAQLVLPPGEALVVVLEDPKSNRRVEVHLESR